MKNLKSLNARWVIVVNNRFSFSFFSFFVGFLLVGVLYVYILAFKSTSSYQLNTESLTCINLMYTGSHPGSSRTQLELESTTRYTVTIDPGLELLCSEGVLATKYIEFRNSLENGNRPHQLLGYKNQTWFHVSASSSKWIEPYCPWSWIWYECHLIMKLFCFRLIYEKSLLACSATSKLFISSWYWMASLYLGCIFYF